MVTAWAALAAVGTAAVAVAVHDLRRWWSGARVTTRLGAARARRPAPAIVVRMVDRAGLDSDPRVLLDAWLGAVVVAIAATPLVAAAPIALAVAVIGPPAALAATHNRAARLRAAQIPVALEAVAASLRGGTTLPVAIGEAAAIDGRVGGELAEVARRIRDGLPVETAVEAWAGGHGADTALAGAALTMAASVGGPAADAVESAAASLRQRAAAADEVAALSVQARLSAIVLSSAPVGFTFLLASVDPGSARFLLGTPAGWACIAVGIGLDAVGAWWMHRLVRGAA